MADARVSALIAAAGAGQRLALGPKAFLHLHGRTLLAWVVDKMQCVADEVVVAVPPDRVAEAAALLPDCRVVAGGHDRHESVRLMAQAATGAVLLLHDAARPFVSHALLAATLEAARETGCAASVLAPEVPVARLSGERLVEAWPGTGLGISQTPQAYAREAMDSMLAHAQRDGCLVVDDELVVIEMILFIPET